MSLKKIKTYISNNFPNWYIAPLYGNKFTYAKGSRSSCIDHVIYNEALAAHFNRTSVCTSFYGISDLYVLFLRKIRVFNPLSSSDSISNFEDYINHYIYLFLLGGNFSFK